MLAWRSGKRWRTGSGLLRQAQDALGDNVGLDFVAATVNRGRLGV